MAEAARWYLALTLIGGGGVLPATLLFGPLRSGGALYARPLALVLVAQAAWLASALAGLPYGLPLILVMVGALWTWSAALAWRRPALWRETRGRWRILLAGEVVCALLFALIVLVRVQAPNAQHTEKPMDLMLITAVRAAEVMPPQDLWFAGQPLAYYHLGAVMVDVVGRLAAQPPAIAFTLALASTGAMAGAAAFALGGDVVALSRVRRHATPWIAGLLAVTLLLFAAPLEGLLELLAPRGIGSEALWARLGVEGFPGPTDLESGVPTQFWWWWRATRVLPGVITEFPAFSIVLGDLHAHLLALPLKVVALAAVLPTLAPRSGLTMQWWLFRPSTLVIAAALFAGLAMTHTWDAAIFVGLWLVAAAAAFLAVGWPLAATLMPAVRHLALPLGVAGLLAWPLLATTRSAVTGIAPVGGPASDPVRLLLIWLPLLLPVAIGAWLLRTGAAKHALAGGLALAVLGVLAWVAFVFGREQSEALRERGAGWITLALLVAGFGGASAAAVRALRERDTALAAWLGLAAAAATIVLTTELVYIVDVFGSRINTVFKFWFTVWLLLAIAGAAALAMMYDRGALFRPNTSLRPRLLTVPLLGLALMLSAGPLLYAPSATVARSREGQPSTLNALAYLDRVDPDVAATLRWIEAHRAELGPYPLLLEAAASTYTEGNLISAASGVPTLLGWWPHQLVWRGPASSLETRRTTVQRIYRDADRTEAAGIAREAGVTHVYLGRQEAAQYGAGLAERFAGWRMLFEAGDSRILAVPAAAAAAAEGTQP